MPDTADPGIAPVVRSFRRGEGEPDLEALLSREWLVPNGLGGYASSSVAGVCTRKYHGLLVAAVAAPHGRMVMLHDLDEEIRLSDGTVAELSGHFRPGGELHFPGVQCLKEFRLENGLPVWRYQVRDVAIEKRVLLPHFQNTAHIRYRLASGAGPVRLRLRPFFRFRSVHEELSAEPEEPYDVQVAGDRFEVAKDPRLPALRLYLYGEEGSFRMEGERCRAQEYPTEARRGYACRESTWTPGFFQVYASRGETAALVASIEPWEVMLQLDPVDALRAETGRRQRLLSIAPPGSRSGVGGELVLAADPFIIAPVARVGDNVRARAWGDEVRSVIAGYHWFTDWGRDTMISLEGLAMATGRFSEAGYVLRTFAYYVKDGLIPNLFPEGQTEGLYHTADATLWFFHAVDRFLRLSQDRAALRQLLPVLEQIVDRHVRGTRFGIGVDPADGLLRQGHPGLPLTWMDAKWRDWVITPRRGKAVEINALWYNALRVLQEWLVRSERERAAQTISERADRVYASFNRKFWYEPGGYLYDVVDGEGGDDPSLRPNQVFAISLPRPVLDPSRWKSVVRVVHERLLTPFGLRSLDPADPKYKRDYGGDLRTRDSAYHQGSVWSWLIGPYVDAWLKVYPQEQRQARRFLDGLVDHLGEACMGSVSEVFDGDPPFRPEGCISQAWSVAELMRSWVNTAEPDGVDGTDDREGEPP
ncbi:MAG: amylo-alpha-1,6-glucosidase [bacterium]